MAAQNTVVWVLGCKFGFVTETVKTKLREATAAQWSMAYESGGKPVVSGSIGGESVAFQLPTNFDPAALAKLFQDTYREITDLTDSELEAYALRQDIAGVRPSFIVTV